ncbi:MAG TPA: hypothetical protein VJ792_01225 [Candidatus Nitrosotalea sp.]|nr:hypothetical protein [Candidatus Nitrosotalea sp.]
MTSKLSVALLLTAVLVASVAVTTIPASNALTPRDYSYLNDNHLTVRTGNTKVCGDHICAPGEWDKMQAGINAAQLGNKTQITPPSTAAPSTEAPSITCAMVKSALASANADPAVAKSVLSALGC